mgnify:FL=1
MNENRDIDSSKAITLKYFFELTFIIFPILFTNSLLSDKPGNLTKINHVILCYYFLIYKVMTKTFPDYSQLLGFGNSSFILQSKAFILCKKAWIPLTKSS